MASTIGGSLFAAVAFPGAGYLFYLLDKGGYSSEMKRHNLAVENLTKAREAWYEEEVRKKDEIARDKNSYQQMLIYPLWISIGCYQKNYSDIPHK